MNTFRNKIKDNFTTVPNEFVNDVGLSWKAKGIFLYLASKPDDWRFSMDHIARQATDQIGALKSGVKELEQAGYLKRDRVFAEDGKIAGYKWTLMMPSKNHQTENPPDGESIGWKTALHTNTDSTNTELTNTKKPTNKERQSTSEGGLVQGQNIQSMIDLDKLDDLEFVRSWSASRQAMFFVELWNRLYDARIKYTPRKDKEVARKTKDYTIAEIVQALQARKRSQWHASKGILGVWSTFWEHGDKVEEFLNKAEPAGAVSMLGYSSQDEDLPF